MCQLSVDPEINLRTLSPHDAEALFRLVGQNRQRVTQFVQMDYGSNIENTRRSIREFASCGSEDVGLYLGIFMNDSLAGQVRLELALASSDVKANYNCNIAYWVGNEFSGKGVAFRCLNVLLPFASEVHWGDRTIFKFHADIRFDNKPSQCVVQRLGFQKMSSADEFSSVLDVISPRVTELWTLDVGNDLRSRLALAIEEYSKSRIPSFSSSTKRENLMHVVSGCLNEIDSRNVDQDPRVLLPDLIKYEVELKRIMNIVAPSRVIGDDFTEIAWVDLDCLQGTWSEPCDDTFRIFVRGTSVIKGYAQAVEHDTDGMLCVAGYSLAPPKSEDTNFVFQEPGSGRKIEWALVNGRVSSGSLQGIFKTPRGYVAVERDVIISSHTLWQLELRNHSWILVQSTTSRMSLETAISGSLIWILEQPVKRMRRASTIEALTWVSVNNSEATQMLDGMCRIHKYRLLQSLAIQRLIEINMLSLVARIHTRVDLHSDHSPTSNSLIELIARQKTIRIDIERIQYSLIFIRQTRVYAAGKSLHGLTSALSDLLSDVITAEDSDIQIDLCEYFS